MPKISVIMGIYNCANTISGSIESIINQTYEDWELIMCDDGSIDTTFDVAKEYQKKYPQKIILLKNKRNRGLNYTLNKCLEIAKGEYIARMDGDDLCSPQRLEKELFVIKKEKGIDIVSTDMTYFDEKSSWGLVRHPEYPKKKDFINGSPFCHAPCLVRRRAFEAVGGYSESKWLLRVEDYHLWLKMYQKGFRGKNIHESLYQMRDDINAFNRRKFKYRLNEAYVKVLVIKGFKLPFYYYVFAFRPILVGILPMWLYKLLHKKKLRLN